MWREFDDRLPRLVVALVRVPEAIRLAKFHPFQTQVWGTMRRTFQASPGATFTPIAPIPRPPSDAIAVSERFDELLFLLGNWVRETARINPRLMHRARRELGPIIGQPKHPDPEEITVERRGNVVLVDGEPLELTRQLADLFMCLWDNAAAGGATRQQLEICLGKPDGMTDTHLGSRLTALKDRLPKHIIMGKGGRGRLLVISKGQHD